ncbi:Fur family transcriptional regulator [Candidatus Hydrogenisulfobacillus filiaventi]|uniref:Fur family transcriptional regulator n=1 Tax=Candidatus Hydrogenisulfobacillus filiaventi TaxID=2707344 RepID=A0A6F8ZH21_9FIRM|nr:Fur family transcriptional regulator [Bacillota bacterium]CAB1129285.1 Fur family transcriptional regulator [Candidatus Hydrogenisulfobacillus filiaventi]
MADNEHPSFVAVWRDHLKAGGMRATPQRLAVLEALEGLSHPTAEEVFQAVTRQYPTISLATVYNTLAQLEERGLVRTVNAAGLRRFDLRTEPHFHLSCVRCHRLTDVEGPVGGAPPAPPAPGWIIDRWELIGYGLCPRCQAAEALSGNRS